MAERMLGVRQGLLELVQAPRVTLQVLLVFRVHGAKLPVQRVFEKQRVDEELRKSIQGLVKRGLGRRLIRGLGIAGSAGSRDLKVIVRRAKGSVCIGIAIVSGQVLIVGILDRVLRLLLTNPLR